MTLVPCSLAYCKVCQTNASANSENIVPINPFTDPIPICQNADIPLLVWVYHPSPRVGICSCRVASHLVSPSVTAFHAERLVRLVRSGIIWENCIGGLVKGI